MKTLYRLLTAMRARWLRRCPDDPEGGATTTEYALLLALVVVVLIGTLTSLGAALNDKLRDIIDQITNA